METRRNMLVGIVVSIVVVAVAVWVSADGVREQLGGALLTV